jgi:heme-degrading monooxygenase HmoA
MHVIMWEFVVRPEKIHEFLAAYQATGGWAQLFGLADGYEGTELLSSTDGADRFVTIDRWRSVDDFARFQEKFGKQYQSLDRHREGFTPSERKLGTFDTGE